MTAVAELTGRVVLDYHSQILFNPVRALEWFVLGPAADDHVAATREAANRGARAR